MTSIVRLIVALIIISGTFAGVASAQDQKKEQPRVSTSVSLETTFSNISKEMPTPPALEGQVRFHTRRWRPTTNVLLARAASDRLVAELRTTIGTIGAKALYIDRVSGSIFPDDRNTSTSRPSEFEATAGGRFGVVEATMGWARFGVTDKFLGATNVGSYLQTSDHYYDGLVFRAAGRFKIESLQFSAAARKYSQLSMSQTWSVDQNGQHSQDVTLSPASGWGLELSAVAPIKPWLAINGSYNLRRTRAENSTMFNGVSVAERLNWNSIGAGVSFRF
jgi:hypothetical protein